MKISHQKRITDLFHAFCEGVVKDAKRSGKYDLGFGSQKNKRIVSITKE